MSKYNIEIGIDPKQDLKLLLDECKTHLQKFDKDLITKAFLMCVNAHKNKKRLSGEPYYTHPLSVALIVVNEIPLDDISVAASLLHGILLHASDKYSLKDIRSEFGNTIAVIVESVTKIQNIEEQNIDQLENYRKLLLSLFKDIRIILIKLADKLHNMRTLDVLPKERQLRSAKEAMEVFAPFANRFGLGNIKWELEDLAFKYTNREAFDEISNSLQLTRDEREKYVENFIAPIQNMLDFDPIFKNYNIPFEISGRPKHLYSIYNKLFLRDKSIDELFDLFAIRIILDTDDSNLCFLVYGFVCLIYKPIPGTFKDYISNPKKNGYQSIHTAVMGPENQKVEVQIRTRKMHEISENGFAAHFEYKRGFLPAGSVLDEQNIEQWMGLVREIFEKASDGEESVQELIENINNNLFQDEIFVFTPTTEFKKLPKDSSPLDFAYSIHTEIGDRCIGAKVNSHIVPLDYKLQSGDQIEILTSKNQKPVKEWLNYVVTHRAKSSIQKFLTEENKQVQKDGELIFNEIREKMNLNISDTDINDIVSYLKFNDKESFFFALGSRNIDYSHLIEYFDQNLNPEQKMKLKYSANQLGTISYNTIANFNAYNSNLKEKLSNISYATCCLPLPGEEIAGRINEQDQLVVHRANCKEIQDLLFSNQPSVFRLDWSAISNKNFTTKIHLFGEISPTVINEINTLIVSLEDTQIRSIHFETTHTTFDGIITIDVKNLEHLTKIFDQLQAIKGIKTVERYLK